MIYKKLDFEEKQKRVKFLLFIMLLVVAVRILSDGGEQQLEYGLYKMQQSKYQITQAEIYEKKDISYYLGKFKLISVYEEKIKYEVDGEEYDKIVHSYSDYNIKDVVPIAVHIENKSNIKRCIPYSKWNNITCIINWILFFVILLFCINIKNIANSIQTIKKRKVSKWIKNKEKSTEMKIGEEDAQKQNRILYIIKNADKKNEIESEKIKTCMLKNEIQWNNDWLWCLYNIRLEELLLLQKEDGEYKFITLTLELRKNNLPPEYYIIHQENNYFLCCKYNSKRIYAFSKSLGITNTQYSNIYDYLLEVLEKRFTNT